MALPSGMVTFLFTDIQDSSRKWDTSQAAMVEALAKHDEILDTAIEEHHGAVVKKIGDGYMAVFSDPAHAVAAAVQTQGSISKMEWDGAVGPLQVRIGIHTGPGDPVDEDYLGPSVNRAARLEGAGHGGQILVSAATRELVGDRVTEVTFDDLGEHQLRGLNRSERIFQVRGDGLLEQFPPLRTDTTPSNLPLETEELIGRDAELQDLVNALRESRLLTVTGAGGVGKTTLAMEAARHMTDQYKGGVWLLELAPLNEGKRIPGELLGAMRHPAPTDREFHESLLDVLESQRALLVLDNCEHLLDEVADLVAQILQRAPQVSILATSREPLGIHSERVWTIPTMGLPETDDLAGVLASDAGALFASRARQADQHIVLDETTAPVAAAICRRLDGLPLAIELAAARLRSMGIVELNDRLQDRFKLLRTSDRDVLPHHQTLRDTVAWSYDLLDPEEQRTYCRLSIFSGGFELDAAEFVADDDPDVLDHLDHLVGQSLIEIDRGASTRYRMLETIKDFGAQLLVDLGEHAEAAERHLAWVIALSREGARGIEGRDQVQWLRRFRTEIDNIRGALGWAVENDPIIGVKLVSSLSRFFWMYAAEGDTAMLSDATSFLREGYDWSTAMLLAAGDDLPEALRGRLQLAIGGLLCVRLGRYDEALERLEEATQIFERLGDERNLGWAAFYQSVAGFGLVDLDESIDLVERALALHIAAEDQVGAGTSLLVAGLFRTVREPGSGRKQLERFAAAVGSSGPPFGIAHAADGLALDAALTDQVSEETKNKAAKAIALFRKTNNYGCLCHALGTAAGVLCRIGDFEGGARVLGLTDAIRDRLSMAAAPYEQRDPYIVEIAGNQAGEESWLRAVAEGATLEPNEGIDWTIRRLGHDPADFD